MKHLENSLTEELGIIFGRDCARVLITEQMGKEKSSKEILIALRARLTEVGGERYAEMIFQQLDSRIRGGIDG